jgi:Zn-dependent M28 family amino/carboxypeptidase
MKKILKTTILFLLIAVYSFKMSAQEKPADTNFIKSIITTLSSDSMGGRKAGSNYEIMASDFIASQFKLLKINPYLKENYFQEFIYNYDSTNYNSRNVIGYINNKSQKNIIICAHYDHIGFGGKRSRSYSKKEVDNGADDNASGVALMLQLAKDSKISALKKYNYIFIAFSGHEEGLFGSNNFVKSNIVDSSSIRLVINLDMVGRLDKNNPTLFVSSNDTTVSKILDKVADNYSDFKLKEKEMPLGDHSPFAKKNIPVLYFTTGTHDDYHKVSDDQQYINYKGIICIEKLLVNF